MSDAALQEYQRARRLLSLGSADSVRQSLRNLRLLDRARRHARQADLLEVGCLIREREEHSAESLLNSLAPIDPAEWQDLVRLLSESPDGSRPNFQRYVAQLGARLDGDPSPPPPPPRRAPQWDPSVLAGIALGGCSLIAAWIVALGMPRGSFGVLPAVLGVMASLVSPRQSTPRLLALTLSISGTVVSLVLIVMELLLRGGSS